MSETGDQFEERTGPQVVRGVQEAAVTQTEHGLVPEGEGWFVVNAREAAWIESDELGRGVLFEGDPPFAELGINIQVLEPGQPNCMYHSETAQEDFLVLSGECLVVVEGEERRMRAWDFAHFPAGTEHVAVGAGDGPCAILMVGARRDGVEIRYPVSAVAGRHGASVERDTTSPAEAYARYERPRPARYREGDLPG